MNVMRRGNLINKINRLVPEARAVPSEEYNGCDGGVWIRGSEDYHNDGTRIFNYWEWADEPHKSPDGVPYKVHPQLRDIISEAGWFSEPQNAGCLMLWK